MFEERAPARLVLLRPFADAKNLPLAFAVGSDGHQQPLVSDFPSPVALRHDAVYLDIGRIAPNDPTTVRNFRELR